MASLGTDSGKSLPDVDEDDGVGSARTAERKHSKDRKQPASSRSKHSVSEQRRRGKINDRFEILKEMLPQNDQKRDKASFLLEVEFIVIEYIRFLHEKVKNYEAGPEWNQENAKQIPWKPADISSDNPYVPKNSGQSPVYIYSGKFENNNVSVAPAVLPNEQNPKESELGAGTPYQGIENPGISSKDLAPLAPMKTSLPASTEGIAGITQLEIDRANVASQSQSHWIRSSCLADCTARSGMLNEHEELAIDEGTIHVSSAYSQELFTTLTRALQSSGVDLSQATLSVQINLGKRAVRRSAATTTISNAKIYNNFCAPFKDHGDPLANQAMGNSTAGSSGEDSEPSPKRHKSDSS